MQYFTVHDNIRAAYADNPDILELLLSRINNDILTLHMSTLGRNIGDLTGIRIHVAIAPIVSSPQTTWKPQPRQECACPECMEPGLR